MRRTTLTAALGLAFVLAGCSGGSGSGSSSTTGGSAAPSGSDTGSGASTPGAVDSGKPQRDANADLVIWADGTAAPTVQKLADKFGFTADNVVKVAKEVMAA